MENGCKGSSYKESDLNIMKKLDEYKLVIWDLDGTLYFQKEFRLKMIMVLLQKLIFTPKHWKDAFVILKYRSLREKWDTSDTGANLEERQYAETGKSFGMSAGQVEEIVSHWMLEEPLLHLKAYRDETAAKTIKKLQEKGIETIVYSDYPTVNKLKALEIMVSGSYAATDDVIACMKPNPKGLRYIINKYQIAKEDTIMIGDRMEKDGEVAIAVGIDYLILQRERKNRELQYEKGIGLL